MTTVVLWASRHNPLKVQVQELKRKLGEDTVIVKGRSFYRDAGEVIDHAKQVGATYIVAVLPLSMIARVTEIAKQHNITILYAEMECTKKLYNYPNPNIDYNPTEETVIVVDTSKVGRIYKVFRFKQFHKIKAVKLELEPL